jgi:competence protein ComEA
VKRVKIGRFEFSLKLFDWVLVGLMILGGGLILWGLLESRGRSEEEVEYLSDGLSDTQEMIWVDVSGAVEKPGVYELSGGSRVKDALVLAGGLSQLAEREYLERVINMAEKLTDGEKIYIPREGSNEGEVLGGSSDGLGGLIDINSASVSELDTLWGVGSVRAQKIIDNRPFSKVEELLSKGVLPENVYEKIKDEISVY